MIFHVRGAVAAAAAAAVAVVVAVVVVGAEGPLEIDYCGS